MSKLKGTTTEKNLLASFAGESQARNRYNYFASIAKKEGYEQISSIFIETADNEKEHAKRFFKFLEGGMLEITATYPAGILSDTKDNLKAAAEGEHEEWTLLYPNAADIAEQEGFPDVASAFRNIAKVEKAHETRYNKLLENILNAEVFKKKTIVKWKCRNCGYVHESIEALEKCPSCVHPKAFFELFVENY